MEKTLIGNVDEIIDEIIKNNKIRRFASELSVLSDSTNVDSTNTDLQRKEDLQRLIDFYTVKQSDTNTGKNTVIKMYDKFNEETLHWKWFKLSIPQQKNRISEYLKRTLQNKNNQIEAEKLFFQLIETGKLKKNAVVYDTVDSKITDIFLEEFEEMKKLDGLENNNN